MCDCISANFPLGIDQLVNKRVERNYTNIRMTKITYMSISTIIHDEGEDTNKLGISYIAGGHVKWSACLKTHSTFSNKIKHIPIL